MQTIILGGGCFWCIEAVFQQIDGVESVVSGYAGGTTPNPSYNMIGDHAEVVQITFDENIVNLERVLDIFFTAHDPTTKNRQGHDVGTQYRSIILCSEDQKSSVRQALRNAEKEWGTRVVTEVKISHQFYKAEGYHQNYYQNNPDAGYCQIVITPKLQKVLKKFS